MATLFPNGLDCPNAKVVILARAHGVVQGQEDPEETAGEALDRLETALIWAMKRPAIQMVKREREAANVAADTDDILVEI